MGHLLKKRNLNLNEYLQEMLVWVSTNICTSQVTKLTLLVDVSMQQLSVSTTHFENKYLERLLASDWCRKNPSLAEAEVCKLFSCKAQCSVQC